MAEEEREIVSCHPLRKQNKPRDLRLLGLKKQKVQLEEDEEQHTRTQERQTNTSGATRETRTS